jgi:uncharacterized protein involved in type VI secretion and phage assembly
VTAMAPRAATADQRILGVVIGVVLDDVDPDGFNRVKIALPWYASGYEHWARVAQFYAGNGIGTTWLPPVDAEVLVAFAHGDMRWPYVLGCLHGPVDTPPVARTAGSDVRTLLTPAGSELTIDETNRTIDLKTAGGASVRLEETSGTVKVEATTKVEITARSVAIHGSDDVTVTGGVIRLN